MLTMADESCFLPLIVSYYDGNCTSYCASDMATNARSVRVVVAVSVGLLLLIRPRRALV